MPGTGCTLLGLFSGGSFRTSAVPQRVACGREKDKAAASPLDLLQRETAWLKKGLFSLLFVYFSVRSPATHAKISLNQEKNPLFLSSSAPVAISLLFLAGGDFFPYCSPPLVAACGVGQSSLCQRVFGVLVRKRKCAKICPQ